MEQDIKSHTAFCNTIILILHPMYIRIVLLFQIVTHSIGFVFIYRYYAYQWLTFDVSASDIIEAGRCKFGYSPLQDISQDFLF